MILENLLKCLINVDFSDIKRTCLEENQVIKTLIWREISQTIQNTQTWFWRRKQPQHDFLKENINITVPPLASNITLEEINELIESKEKREFLHLSHEFNDVSAK